MDTSLLLPAILTGIFAYLGAIETPWLLGMTGGFYILGRPLVAGLLVGIAFGDITAGVLSGLAVQGVFIANLTTGGATNSEITYASYGGIGLAMATTKDPAIAITLSILIGQTFGLIFYNTRMALYSFWNKRAQDAAENNDTRGITLNHLIYPQITTFLLRAVPITIAILFGSGFVDSLLASFPEVITDIIEVLGGVLPALGIAMLMSIVIEENLHFIFFLFGFVLIAFADFSMIVLVIVAALIAYIVYLTNSNSGNVVVTETNGQSQTVNENVPDNVYEDEDLF